MDDDKLSFVGWLVGVCGANFCGGISLTLFIGLIINLINLRSTNRPPADDAIRPFLPLIPLGIGIVAAVDSLWMTLHGPPELREAGYGMAKIQLTIAVLSAGALAIMTLIHRRWSSHRNGTVDNTKDSKQAEPD